MAQRILATIGRNPHLFDKEDLQFVSRLLGQDQHAMQQMVTARWRAIQPVLSEVGNNPAYRQLIRYFIDKQVDLCEITKAKGPSTESSDAMSEASETAEASAQKVVFPPVTSDPRSAISYNAEEDAEAEEDDADDQEDAEAEEDAPAVEDSNPLSFGNVLEI